MSIATIVTRGYGPFGTIADVVRAGYEAESGAGEVVTPPVTQVVLVGDGESWQDYVTAEFRKNHLLEELKQERKELKKVEKKIAKAKVQVKKEKTEGILANLFRLEMRKVELENKIQAMKVEMIPLERFLDAEIDEDDEEVLLLQ